MLRRQLATSVRIILLLIGQFFLKPEIAASLMLTPSHEINESQSQVTASAKNVLESNPMLQHLQDICVCVQVSAR